MITVLNLLDDVLWKDRNANKTIAGTNIMNGSLISKDTRFVEGIVLMMLKCIEMCKDKKPIIESEQGQTKVLWDDLILIYSAKEYKLKINRTEAINLFPLVLLHDHLVGVTIPSEINSLFLKNMQYEKLYRFVEDEFELFQLVTFDSEMSRWGDLDKFILRPLDEWDEEQKANILYHREKYAYVQIDELVYDYLQWFQTEDAGLMSGPTSAGKTSYFGKIASLLGIPFYSQNFDKDTDPDKILGQFLPSENGGYKYVYSPLVKAFKFGGFYLGDEINMVSGDITAVFHSILDGQGSLILPTGETVYRHRLFRMGAGINEQYSGTKPMNVAFLRRMKRKDRLPSMSYEKLVELSVRQYHQEVECGMIDKTTIERMAKVCKDIETKYQEQQVRDASIGITHLFSWVRQYINTKDWVRSAESTIVNLSCEDIEVNQETMIIVKKYAKK